jgi:hypothetical protein
MPSFDMLHRVALVRSEVSEEHVASIIMVTRIGDLRTLSVTSNRSTPLGNTIVFCHSDEGGVTFPQNIGSYKSHTNSYPRKRHSS